jgi:hypothetical protein
MSKVSRETVVPPPTPRETNLANRSRWESAYGRADAELTRRRAEWQPPAPKATRGYGKLFQEEITQAHEGCDFRFLHRGEKMTEPAIY